MRHWQGSRSLGVIVLALVLTLPAWLPLLLNAGLVNTRAGGDSPFLLQRVHQMSIALRAGHIPARWMPDASFGYGYPFWNYYAPLAYYASAAFHLLGLGIVNAIKLTQIAGFVVAALSMYVFALDIFERRAAAFLCAAAYTFAPFHLINVYVRGDSLGEFWAFALYPLVFLAVRQLRSQPGPGTAAFGALAYGSLIVTHNISALIVTPIAGAYALFLLLFHGREPSRQQQDEALKSRYLLWLLAALGTGLLMSAWYWAPALLERSAVQLESNLTGYFHYAGHFRSLRLTSSDPPPLIQSDLLFDYSIGDDATPFVVGSMQALLALAGFLVLMALLLRRKRTTGVRSMAFFAGAGLAATLLITPCSEPVWARTPLLPFVQFPWRWLSVQAFALSIVVGGSVVAVPATAPRRWGKWLTWATAIGVSAVLMFTSMWRLDVDYLPLRAGDVSTENLMFYEMFTGNIGSTVRAEYLPAAVVPRPWTSQRLATGHPPPPLSAQTGRLLAAGPAEQRWQITVDEARDVVLPTYWFPGWRAAVDGAPVPTSAQPEHGGIRVSIPPGTHTVRLALGRTGVRAGAELASLIGIVLWLGFVVQSGLWRWWLRLSTVAAVILIATGLLIAIAATLTRPAPAPVSLDYSRRPYPHPNPGGIQVGDDALLTDYTFSTSEAAAGQAWRLRLTWADVAPDAEIEATLVSPAEVLFHVPAAIAMAVAPLTESMSLELALPTHASPGVYLPRLTVRRDNEADATAYLQPMRIVGPLQGPVEGPVPGEREPPPKPVGDAVSVAVTRTSHPKADQLEIELTWWPEQEMLANYATSLRLKEPTGRTIAQVDTQPCYGFCPTSSWRTGVPVYDRRWLEIPPGTAPGSDYSLEVVVYHVEDLTPLGSAHLPGISLPDEIVEHP